MSRLAERLVRLIRAEGPLTVAQYMTLCLLDPQDGYYATRPALGEGGDFLTAPEVSQMFGEMLGVWAVMVWEQLGRPARFRLVELGPGTGALMSDLWRAARGAPGFVEAAELWLVEASAPLQALQTTRLADAAPRHVRQLDDVPGGAPMILVANEFLDCLPVRQFVRHEGVWAEQRIGLGDDDQLVFGLAPAPSGLEGPAAPDGTVWEQSGAQTALAQAIAERVVRGGGAALLIDYGRDQPGFGDTLQALAGHHKVDPLATPGLADLTAHVDFPEVAQAARLAGAQATPITTQGAFLARLGVLERAEALCARAPERFAVVERQLQRLLGDDQMGRLFKVLALHSPGVSPPGFESAEEQFP